MGPPLRDGTNDLCPMKLSSELLGSSSIGSYLCKCMWRHWELVCAQGMKGQAQCLAFLKESSGLSRDGRDRVSL